MHEHDWQTVFVTHDPLELGAALGVLEQQGVRTRVRDLSVTPYPVSLGPLAEKRILVPADKAEHARRLIEEAVADGFLTTHAEESR